MIQANILFILTNKKKENLVMGYIFFAEFEEALKMGVIQVLTESEKGKIIS
jgi:hypothetical protein